MTQQGPTTTTAPRTPTTIEVAPEIGALALRENTASTTMAFVPTTLGEAMQLAELLARSSIVPPDFQGKPGDVFVAMQYGMEVGLSPLQALQSIAVVNRRPCMWGDAVLGLVRRSKLLEEIKEEFHAVEGEPLEKVYAVCRVKRRGEAEPVERRFSWRDAVRAGLADKPLYKQYPQRMLAMRARSWALRDVFGDVLRGLQIREEVEDYHADDPSPSSARVEPAPEPDLMPRRKSETAAAPGVSAGTAQNGAPHHDGSDVVVPPGAPVAEPEVLPAVAKPDPASSEDDDYLAAQLGLDPTAALTAEPTPPPDPDTETRAALIEEYRQVVADRSFKAAYVAARWDKIVGTAEDAAPVDKLRALIDALKAVPAPVPPTPAAPASATEVRFTIGKTEYVTAGITKAQLIKVFRLGDDIKKKIKAPTGADLAAQILQREFKCVSRTELTEEAAEKYLIRLTELAEGR